MNYKEFPLWPAPRRKVQLGPVLGALPDQPRLWLVSDLDCVLGSDCLAQAPDRAEDVRALWRREREVLCWTWPALRRFAGLASDWAWATLRALPTDWQGPVPTTWQEAEAAPKDIEIEYFDSTLLLLRWRDGALDPAVLDTLFASPPDQLGNAPLRGPAMLVPGFDYSKRGGG